MDELYDKFNVGLGKSDKVFADLTRDATRCMLDVHDIMDEVGTVKGILLFQQSVWEKLHDVTKEKPPQPVDKRHSADTNEHEDASGSGSGPISQPRTKSPIGESSSAQVETKGVDTLKSSKPIDCPWDPDNCKMIHLKMNSVLDLAKHIAENAEMLKGKVRPGSPMKLEFSSKLHVNDLTK